MWWRKRGSGFERSLAWGVFGRQMILNFRTFCLIGILSLGALLCWVDNPLYAIIAALPDGIHRRLPFEDLAAILRAGTCWRHGVDVYRPSPCLAGGVYNYSPLLLRASYLPVTAQDSMVFGFVMAACFIMAEALVPRPSGLKKFVAFMTISPPVLYALEQGNFDLMIFVLVCLGLRLLQRYPACGFALFALAAGAKFYPASLCSLVLREPLGRFIQITLVLGAAVLAFLYGFGHGAAEAAAIIPLSQPFRATFGAIDLPLGLKLLLHVPVIRAYYPAASLTSSRPFLQGIATLFSVVAIWHGMAAAPRYRSVLPYLTEAEKIFLWAGLALIVLCFFLTQNVAYRCIFMIFAAPGLWHIGQRSGQFGLYAAVLALMWEAVPRQLLIFLAPWSGPAPAILFWLAREALWWWVISQFTAILYGLAMAEVLRLRREAGR